MKILLLLLALCSTATAADPLYFKVWFGPDVIHREREIRAGLQAWSNAVGARWEVVRDDKKANIKFAMTRNPRDAGSYSILDLTIRLNVSRLDRVQLSNTVQHEVGHFLGLWEHSPNYTDIMYGFTHAARRISKHEIESVKKIWSISTREKKQ